MSKGQAPIRIVDASTLDVRTRQSNLATGPLPFAQQPHYGQTDGRQIQPDIVKSVQNVTGTLTARRIYIGDNAHYLYLDGDTLKFFDGTNSHTVA
jgi:hypothetical protein